MRYRVHFVREISSTADVETDNDPAEMGADDWMELADQQDAMPGDLTYQALTNGNADESSDWDVTSVTADRGNESVARFPSDLELAFAERDRAVKEAEALKVELAALRRAHGVPA